MADRGPSLNRVASWRIIADYGAATGDGWPRRFFFLSLNVMDSRKARPSLKAQQIALWKVKTTRAKQCLRTSKGIAIPYVAVSFAATGAGALLPIQFGINPQLARVVGSSLAASAILFWVGTWP